MRTIRIIIAGAALIGLISCGSSEVTTVGNPSSDTVFYDATLEVAPSFAPEGSNSALIVPPLKTAVWENGNPVYELFYLLRDFDPETDQGVIDTSNLYKTMWEARGFLSNTKANCNAITEQVIVPPFDFGNPDTTYNCAYNEEAEDGYDFGGAYKGLDADGNLIEVTDESWGDTSAAVKEGLFGFVWVDDHSEYGAMQASLDSGTGDLSIDIAMWVDYDDQNDYCYRNDIDGNTATHAFTFRSIKGNRVEGGTYTSVVGSGISQGEGEYYLLKRSNGDPENERYYCIGAEDGETELQAMDDAGSESVDANCAEYRETVDAIEFLTPDDLACEAGDFNPGGTGAATEGSIFLGFE